jgi:hypothetical protein
MLSVLPLYKEMLLRKKYEKNCMPLEIIMSLQSKYSGKLDVLLFGDSVTERISSNDRDQRNIGEMLRDAINQDMNFYSMSFSAYNMEIFYLITLTLQYMHFKIKKIIIPINLRSFSSQWQNNPLFKCSLHIRQITGFLREQGCDGNDHLIMPSKSIKSFLKEKVSYPIVSYQTNKEFLDKIRDKENSPDQEFERRKTIFIYNYMYNLSPMNPRLLLIKEICSVASSLDAQLIFYITPINIEGGESYVGEDFVKTIDANIKILHDQFTHVKKCTGLYARLYDYSRSFDSSFFFNKYEATEHLNENGRAAITENLAKALLM